MSAQDVIVRLRAQGQAQFTLSMDSAAASVEKVGASSETTEKSVKRSSKRMSSHWGGMLKGMAAVGAITAAQKGLRDSVSGAVDLGEEVNKTGVVFRQNGAALVQWSKSSAQALGMSQQQALSAASTFGNMLVPMGFARGKAAGMSQSMVKLAADLASFNNASPESTLEALRSGLAGETEPLRKFGVFLSDARLKQQALSMGIYKGKGPLDAAAKAQATYALILKDSKDAQGDFARTSGSLANQQRILKAQYTNVAATLGKQLLPVLTMGAGVLSSMASNMGLVLAVVAPLTVAFIAYRVAAIAATVASLGLNAAWLLIPLAIAAVVAGLIIAYKKVGWFRSAVNWLWGAIKSVAAWLKANWKTVIVGVLTGPFGLAVKLIHDNWDKIKRGASSVLDWFKGLGGKLVHAVVMGLTAQPRMILDAIKSLLPGGKLGAKLLDVLHIPGHAFGGVMPHTGLSVVGERGPELVQLPGGSRITPLSSGMTSSSASISAGAASRAPIVTQVYLDRRMIATAVAEDTADRKARR